jgi:hypothetical protein
MAIKNTEAIIVLTFTPFLFPLFRRKGVQKYTNYFNSQTITLTLPLVLPTKFLFRLNYL